MVFFPAKNPTTLSSYSLQLLSLAIILLATVCSVAIQSRLIHLTGQSDHKIVTGPIFELRQHLLHKLALTQPLIKSLVTRIVMAKQEVLLDRSLPKAETQQFPITKHLFWIDRDRLLSLANDC